MFIGIAIFASVVLWLMVKERGFRRVVFIGAGVAAVIGVCIAIWYYAIQLPMERREANAERAKQEATAKYTVESPPPGEVKQAPDTSFLDKYEVKPETKPLAEGSEVKVRGPDGKLYGFPAGTTKESAIAYFKRKGIGAAPEQNKGPDGYIKESTIVYRESNLSGRAIGSAELNDMVKIVARDNIYRTLYIRDMKNKFEGWVPEDNVVFVTVGPAVVNTDLPSCPTNDPLGILDGSKPCKPLSPKKGASPCPKNDPAGLYTSSPCAPSPQ